MLLREPQQSTVDTSKLIEPPPLPPEGPEDNTEQIDLGGDKTQQLSAVKEPGFLDRARQALKNTVGSKEFWFKERSAVTNKDDDSRAMRITKNLMRAGGVLGKAAFDMAGSVTGAKVLFDLPLHLLQSNEVKNNKAEALKILTGAGAFEEKQQQIKSLLEQASMAKKLTAQEAIAFNAGLATIEKSGSGDSQAKYEALLDSYLQAKTSGMQVARQGLNTLFMLTGTSVLRAGATLSLKGLETFAASRTEATRDQMTGGEKTTAEVLKAKFKEGFLKTATLGMMSTEQNRSGMKKFADAAQALGTIGTFLGIGSAAFQEVSHGTVSHNIGEVFTKLRDGEIGQFVGHNIEANTARMSHLYLEGGMKDQIAGFFGTVKKGVGGALENWFGGGAAKSEAVLNAARVAHGAAEDGAQATQEMSIDPNPTIVDERVSGAARAAGGAILGAHGEAVAVADRARGFVGETLNKMVEHQFAPENQYGPDAALAGQPSQTVEFTEGEAEPVVVERVDVPADKTVTFEESEVEPVVATRARATEIVRPLKVEAIDDGEISPEGRKKTTAALEAAAKRLDAIGDERAAAKAAADVELKKLDSVIADLKNAPQKSAVAEQLAAAESGRKTESHEEIVAQVKAEVDKAMGPVAPAERSTASKVQIEEIGAGEITPAGRKKITKALEAAAKRLDAIGDERAAAKAAADIELKKLDSAIADLKNAPQKSAVAEQLAAAESGKPIGAKSALRQRLEAIDQANRTLVDEKPEPAAAAPARAAESVVDEQAAHKAEVRARVKAEVDKAFAPVASKLEELKPAGKSEVAQQLAAAETAPKKSALRLKMEATDAAARQLEANEEPAVAEQQPEQPARVLSKAEQVKAVADENLAALDKQVDELRAPKPKSALAEQLAAAEDQKALAAKQELLRQKIDAADQASRQLQGPDRDQAARGKNILAGMKKVLEEGGASTEKLVDRGMIEDTVNNQISKYGLRVGHNGALETHSFKPSKAFQKYLDAQQSLSERHPLAKSGLSSETFAKLPSNGPLDAKGEGLLSHTYQIGVLEREAAQLPDGPAKDAVLSLKKSLQGELDAMVKDAGAVVDKKKVSKMIASIAKNPDNF